MENVSNNYLTNFAWIFLCADYCYYFNFKCCCNIFALRCCTFCLFRFKINRCKLFACKLVFQSKFLQYFLFVWTNIISQPHFVDWPHRTRSSRKFAYLLTFLGRLFNLFRSIHMAVQHAGTVLVACSAECSRRTVHSAPGVQCTVPRHAGTVLFECSAQSSRRAVHSAPGVQCTVRTALIS